MTGTTTPLDLRAGEMRLADLRRVHRGPVGLRLHGVDLERIDASAALVDRVVARGDAVYGINTGFGLLSHAAGIGDDLPDEVVRLALALKVNALARGHSGVSRSLVDALIALLRHDVLPRVPAQGSVGASGDLAPLAHLSALLLGIGEARVDGRIVPAVDALRRAGLEPLRLRAKEGLAMINGTQVSSAIRASHVDCARVQDP
jgi:histidine ammonia-lyase